MRVTSDAALADRLREVFYYDALGAPINLWQGKATLGVGVAASVLVGRAIGAGDAAHALARFGSAGQKALGAALGALTTEAEMPAQIEDRHRRAAQRDHLAPLDSL